MATQQVTGLVSGFDTASIVEQLMSIERQSETKVSEKVQMEKLKLQAYQSVNSMLSSLKTSINNLSSSSLWNAKTASSTNESSLTATATQYAVEGSYSLRVAQLATSTQYLSKGYSSQTSTVIPAGSETTSGTITLESSQARVDNSAKLEELNGGKGIYRGSIRITDSTGASVTVDLSACETIEEVVKEINGAANVQIEASIKDGSRLKIVDVSGGTGVMKIQNVGQGTTATDLGIAGTSTAVDGVPTISGSDIYYMSSGTLLSTLRDGLGVEDGQMCITVQDSGRTVDILVDLSGAETVGDILNRVNNAIQSSINASGDNADLIEGLALSINDDRNGLTFTGGQAGNIYTVTEVWGSGQMANPETVEQLGLLGTYTVAADGDSFGGERLLGDANSPMLKNLSGANETGIGSESSQQKVSSGVLDADTLLSGLNGGAGVEISNALQIRLYEAGGDSYRQFDDLLSFDELRALVNTEGATLGQLVDYINDKFANCGVPALESVQVKIDSDGMGVYFDGLSSAHDYVFAGNLAQSLGLVYMDDGDSANGWGAKLEGSAADSAALEDLYSVSAIGPNEGNSMVTEGTALSELTVDGVQITQEQLDAMLVDGGLTLTIGSGADAIDISVDLSELTGDSTVEDLLNTVNAAIYYQVKDADPDAAAPFLAIDFTSMGLNWRNVDLSRDFAASGGLAATLGIDKSYAGEDFASYSTNVQKNLNPVVTGTAVATDVDGGQTLASLNAGSGLTLLGDKLTLTFGADGGDQSIINITRDELIAELGGSFTSATVDQYLAALNSLVSQKIDAHADLAGTGAGVTFGLSDDGKGITITAVAGRTGDEVITLGGDMATASSTGLAAASVTEDNFTSPAAADIRGVAIEEVEVGGVGYINVKIGDATYQLNTDGLSQDSTLNDLLSTLNSQLAGYGFANMYFTTSDSGTGIAFVNDSSQNVTFLYDEVSTLASDLGLVGKTSEKTDTAVSGNSHLNGTSLNRNYVDRSTRLSTLNNGAGADLGVIKVTNAQGTSVTIDLGAAETIGDVLDAINGTLYGVQARINDRGDGIIIEQTTDSKLDGTDSACTGNISVSSNDGTKTAEHLGIAGTGVGGEDGLSVLDGSFKTVIEVGANDTLTDIMNRIANLDAGYKTSIINDGTGTNSYRLSISSGSTGSGNDFIIDTDLDIFGFQQVSRAQDAIVLYGSPDSGVSPVMLKSATNSNNQAILGLTLELNATSDTYTTIKVDTDTTAVVEEIQNLVQAYNDLSDLITYLDSYDTENDTNGILQGDSNLRNLMSQIDDMFYQTFNPNNLSYADIAASSTKSTWSWFDLGISFSTNNTASDGESGSYYSRMELDLDVLNEMVSSNWDALKAMMSSTRNISDTTLGANVAATAGFNFKYDLDENGKAIKPDNQSDPDAGADNDKTTVFTANKTIAEGENQYTVYFQQAASIDRISIYHPNSSDTPASEYALSDFIVEYLDANTGEWVTEREVSGNTSASTIIGLGGTVSVLAVRVTATGTNADDGKFRIADIQCLESNGLAGQLNTVVNSLTDVVDGWYVSINESVNEKITDLQESLEKIQTRLDAKEEALYRQFTAMETALSQLQNQGNYLTSMLSSSSSSS